MMEKEYTYATAVARLEEILQMVQDSNEDIDGLYRLFKEADELIRFCRARLYEVDEEVKSILGSLGAE